MITALVLLNAERTRINEVAEQLLKVKDISEVYSVSGRYDLVAMVRCKDSEGLAAVVTNDLLKISGITRSETLMAFRAYSRHDLEAMFSVGAD
jgi:DNA-binding Lrp family transcriptional regulator